MMNKGKEDRSATIKEAGPESPGDRPRYSQASPTSSQRKFLAPKKVKYKISTIDMFCNRMHKTPEIQKFLSFDEPEELANMSRQPGCIGDGDPKFCSYCG